MGRIYTVTTGAVAITTAIDLLTITAPADMVVAIHGFHITNSSDAGDAQSEQLLAQLHRTAAAGSGGSGATIAPLHIGDAASTVTATKSNDTQATLATLLDGRAFNVMAGLEVIYTPETRPIISPSKIIALEIEGAPADSITLSTVMTIEEIGG